LRAGVPAAIALGAALVIVADAASRAMFAPLEIPLGVLLAFIGVPAFLYLYLRGSARAYA
jgi:iron complex transport system permease protein